MNELKSGQLERVVPSRVKVVKFNWIKKDFSVFDKDWRRIRGKMRDPMFECKWCKKPFEEGDIIALGQPEKGKNMTLCQKCATEAILEG